MRLKEICCALARSGKAPVRCGVGWVETCPVPSTGWGVGNGYMWACLTELAVPARPDGKCLLGVQRTNCVFHF